MQGSFYDPQTLAKLQEEILSILDDFLEICAKYHLAYYGIAGTAIGAIRHGGFIPWDDDIDLAMPRADYEKLCRIVKREFSDRYVMLNAKNYPGYPLMTTRMVKRGTIFREAVMEQITDCPFGIFLDLYVLDPIPDGRLAREKQAWTAWFFSKLMILRRIARPTLAQKGRKAALIRCACSLAHRLLVIGRVDPVYLRKRCEAECRRYEGQKTRRIAFLPDTSPYWNTIDVTRLYPLRRISFAGRVLTFPANIEEMLTAQYGNFMEMPPVEDRKTHTPSHLKFSDRAQEENL